jgi:hypothetical protein
MVGGILKPQAEKHISRTFSTSPAMMDIIDKRAKKRFMNRSAYLVSLVVADIESDELKKKKRK